MIACTTKHTRMFDVVCVSLPVDCLQRAFQKDKEKMKASLSYNLTLQLEMLSCRGHLKIVFT